MPKLVELTSDEGTIYVNPTKVRIVDGPSKSNRNQSVIAFDNPLATCQPAGRAGPREAGRGHVDGAVRRETRRGWPAPQASPCAYSIGIVDPVCEPMGPLHSRKSDKNSDHRLRKMGPKALASAKRSAGDFLPQDPIGPRLASTKKGPSGSGDAGASGQQRGKWGQTSLPHKPNA